MPKRGRPRKNRSLYIVKKFIEYTSDSESDANNVLHNTSYEVKTGSLQSVRGNVADRQQHYQGPQQQQQQQQQQEDDINDLLFAGQFDPQQEEEAISEDDINDLLFAGQVDPQQEEEAISEDDINDVLFAGQVHPQQEDETISEDDINDVFFSGRLDTPEEEAIYEDEQQLNQPSPQQQQDEPINEGQQQDDPISEVDSVLSDYELGEENYSVILEHLKSQWVLTESIHCVSKTASEQFWKIALMNFTKIANSDGIEMERKIPQFKTIRRQILQDTLPPIHLQIGYKNKASGEIVVVNDTVTPMKNYPTSRYEKLYEIGTVKVSLCLKFTSYLLNVHYINCHKIRRAIYKCFFLYFSGRGH